MIIFTALSAGSYGGGTLSGMIAALTAYRFLVGIGIGGEYPAGSVAAAEASGEVKTGTRNTWFILFTNVAIDWGFVIGAFVPYILVLIFTENHMRAIWRVALGLGVVPPIILLLMRLKLQEPEEFKRESMKHVKIPYGLVLKYYWFRLCVVGLIWFLYDVSQNPSLLERKKLIRTVLRLCFWHLLLHHRLPHHRRLRLPLNRLRLEYSHQSLLHPRRHDRRPHFRQNWTPVRPNDWCYPPSRRRLHHGRLLRYSHQARSYRLVRCRLWHFPLAW